MSLNYKPTEWLSVSLDALNLNSPELNYYQSATAPTAFYNNGRQFYFNASRQVLNERPAVPSGAAGLFRAWGLAARELPLSIGWRAQHWMTNCVAVGLSGGFPRSARVRGVRAYPRRRPARGHRAFPRIVSYSSA